MKSKALGTLGLGILVASVALAGTFTIDSGEVLLDLADLLDGETRVVGEGDRQVTVTREGDRVSIRHDEGSSHSCNLATDTCLIRQLGDERLAISIERTQECHGAECEDMDINITTLGGDGLASVVIDTDCEGDDCNAFASASRVIRIATDGSDHGSHASTWVSADGDTYDTGNANVFMFDTLGSAGGTSGGVLFIPQGGLRQLTWKPADDIDGCPSGTRTMRFTDESADDGYLCVRAPEVSANGSRATTGGTGRVRVKTLRRN